MADSSWDNGGQSTRAKQGMSIWAKVALGCGVVVLLGLGGCVVLGATCAHAIGKSMDGPEWGHLRRAVEQLGSDAGAKDLYEANPDLWKAYPSENDFIKTAQSWRPKLEPLPAQMPGVFGGHINYTVNMSGGFRRVELGYTNSKNALVSSRWENGRLQTIEVH